MSKPLLIKFSLFEILYHASQIVLTQTQPQHFVQNNRGNKKSLKEDMKRRP